MIYFFLIFWENLLNPLIIYDKRLDIGNYLMFVLVRYCYSALLLGFALNSVNIDFLDMGPTAIHTNSLHKTHIKDYTRIVGFG